MLFYAILLFTYRKYLTSKKVKEKNKKGIKTLIIVAVIFVVAIVAFFVNGISIYTQSCVFSTKYYAEPRRAFEKEYTSSAVTEPIEIKNDIY